MKLHALLMLPILCACHDAGRGTRTPPSLATGGAPAAINVSVSVSDSNPWHVYPPGTNFPVTVAISDPGPAPVFVRWVDAESKPLATPVRVYPGTPLRLWSPGTDVGYYGIVFSSTDSEVAFPPQAKGFDSNEFGFAILPPAVGRSANPNSPFGLIHARVLANGRWDPYLAGQHVKTLTWRTLSPGSWGAAITERSSNGVIETPLINEWAWETSNYQPISGTALGTLAATFEPFVAVNPNALEWQLGLEENAGSRFRSEPYYFSNLFWKTDRLRQVTDRYRPQTRFVFNMRAFDYSEYEQLAASAAMAEYQVLSFNPYRWPDFPTPETWLVDHIRRLREILDRNGHRNVKLWLGELGIPVRGPRDPNAFFGYPSSNTRIPGATRDYAARYLVKATALALQENIERIFYYNYQNRGDDIDYAEHHFGMRAYTGDSDKPGHPLPSYVATMVLMAKLHNKVFAGSIVFNRDLRLFRFADFASGEDTYLVWVHPDNTYVIGCGRLGIPPERLIAIENMYGTPIGCSGAPIPFTSQPIYIRLRR